MTTPLRTATGKAQHERAWETPPFTDGPLISGHTTDPEYCESCDTIALIEAEAATRDAAPTLDAERRVHDILRDAHGESCDCDLCIAAQSALDARIAREEAERG